MGTGQLDDLYKLVLTSWENADDPAVVAQTQLDGFHHVIGTILVLEKPLTIRQIIALLSDIPEDEFDVANFLQQMRSVLIPGTTTSFDCATPQMHKSFRDYTMSERAPPGFRILTRDAHFKIAKSCLDIIVKQGASVVLAANMLSRIGMDTCKKLWRRERDVMMRGCGRCWVKW